MARYYYGYTPWADSYSVFDSERKNEWGERYCVVPLVTRDEAIRCVKCLNEGKDEWDWKREIAHVAGHIELGQEPPDPMPLSVRFYVLDINAWRWRGGAEFSGFHGPFDTLEEANTCKTDLHLADNVNVDRNTMVVLRINADLTLDLVA